MISQSAKLGIEHIFTKAAKANLVLDLGDSCIVDELGQDKIKDFPEKSVIVLTISTFIFRLLVILHVAETPAAASYFTSGSSSKTLVDALSEMGNLCCGAMNRDLLQHFSHLGMSTPYVLDSKCMAFLGELKPGYVTAFEVTINGAVQLHVSICLCDYAPIDFKVDMTTTQHETGELELF